MPDDDGTRRRVGDETKGRIADLASGWKVEPVHEPVATPAAPTSPPRKRTKTLPPPPPGSSARKALEEAIVETKSPDLERSQPATNPPPVRARQTSPPPIPAIPPIPRVPPIKSGPQPSVIVDQSLTTPDPDGKLAVPVGEFDASSPTIDEERLRAANSQSTIKRDAAEALLQIAQPARTVVKQTPVEVLLSETAQAVRGDPTSIDPATSPFERGDATEIEGPSMRDHAPAGTLRANAALRRKRGVVGDVYYVFTALFGVRRSRREVIELEQRQQIRQASRRRHLVTLGRTAVTADAFDHPALGRAREDLQRVEDERARHAGAVAASDAELDRVRRDRDAKAKQYAVDTAALDGELAALAKRLEPLDKEAAVIKRRSAELRESLQRIAKRLTETEGLLVSVKAEKLDRAGIQADIATLRADRQSVQRDEPKIASELDALNPRIAAIEAARADAQKKRAEVERAELEDGRRTTELYEAIGAKRKVVERAAAEAEVARDRVLFELGERLNVDRPPILGAQLAPIDQIDLELGECDRRLMELREILSNVDKVKIVRGAAVIVGVLAIATVVLGWVIYMLA